MEQSLGTFLQVLGLLVFFGATLALLLSMTWVVLGPIWSALERLLKKCRPRKWDDSSSGRTKGPESRGSGNDPMHYSMTNPDLVKLSKRSVGHIMDLWIR